MTDEYEVPPLDRQAAVRMLHFIDYCGPWDYLEGFFFGVRRDSTLRWEVREGSLLERLGTFCDHRNRLWHDRHLRRGTRPWRIWKRRS